MPWVQTAGGGGQIIAPNPADRVQAITAFVQGRVERWHVDDGQAVKEEDPIVQLVDNDPLLLKRLEAERGQVEAEIRAAEKAVLVAEGEVNQTKGAVEKGTSRAATSKRRRAESRSDGLVWQRRVPSLFAPKR